MTSRQLQRKLADAIGIIERCERVLDDLDLNGSIEAKWTKRDIEDFLNDHRQDIREGGQP